MHLQLLFCFALGILVRDITVILDLSASAVGFEP